mmetsp:Transcript_24299/g.43092  ORF Transcript_24299/g.43092 Transcript_24299/m.43092 type:complete len:339 (-) Transcript_24299:207-1223(-)
MAAAPSTSGHITSTPTMLILLLALSPALVASVNPKYSHHHGMAQGGLKIGMGKLNSTCENMDPHTKCPCVLFKPTVGTGEFNKLITLEGEFFVNGEKLGQGKWIGRNRFVVFVKTWGKKGLWWVAQRVAGGMKTICTESRRKIMSIIPTHFEPIAHPSQALLSSNTAPDNAIIPEDESLNSPNLDNGTYIQETYDPTATGHVIEATTDLNTTQLPIGVFPVDGPMPGYGVRRNETILHATPAEGKHEKSPNAKAKKPNNNKKKKEEVVSEHLEKSKNKKSEQQGGEKKHECTEEEEKKGLCTTRKKETRKTSKKKKESSSHICTEKDEKLGLCKRHSK